MAIRKPAQGAPATQPQKTISGIAGVIIWTDDFLRLLAFYRDTLGLKPRSLKPNFANFEWADFRLSIGAHSRVSGRSKEPDRIMLNLRVDDIHVVCARLRAASVTFTRPPEKEKWGGYVATFLDPDGNTLQLLQLPRQPA